MSRERLGLKSDVGAFVYIFHPPIFNHIKGDYHGRVEKQSKREVSQSEFSFWTSCSRMGFKHTLTQNANSSIMILPSHNHLPTLRKKKKEKKSPSLNTLGIRSTGPPREACSMSTAIRASILIPPFTSHLPPLRTHLNHFWAINT